jgi:acyl transferase domain-containing protein
MSPAQANPHELTLCQGESDAGGSGWVEGTVRRGGVNFFGFGGTNAHAILEEYKAPPSAKNLESGAHYVFPISAKTPERLAEVMDLLLNSAESPDTNFLKSFSYTLQMG